MLPEGVAEHVGPLLAAIDRAGLRYDITTDVALARGQGPKLSGHSGVVLAGDTRWMDGGVQRSLRAWVRGGGRLLQTGTGSLRRSVDVTPARIVAPTQPTPRDLFGARLGNVTAAPGADADEHGRPHRPVPRHRRSARALRRLRGRRARSAPTSASWPSPPPPTRSTTSSSRSRFGKGVVVRLGVPDFSARLSSDPELVTLLKRTWTLLRFR